MAQRSIARDTDRQLAVGRTIDELVTTEIRFPNRRSSGMVKDLYDAALAEEGEPLSYAAGRSLQDVIDRGDTVIIATGAGKGKVNLPRGETDGPLGAVGVAAALARGFGVRPVITTEDHCIEPTIAALRAGGLNDISYEELQERYNAATVVPYPKEREEGIEAAQEFIEKYDPKAIIAVEKGGPNREGVYHSASGSSMDIGRAKIAPLFDLAADEGILTVGIGDNGNEIGFGKIEEAVRDIQPFGETCKCTCEGGITTRVATDHMIVANVSNWGAYGLEAMLALLSETSEAMHSPDEESQMLERNTLAGSNDGVYDMPLMRVDGTAEATNRGVVAMLQDIVEMGLSKPYDRGF